MARISMCNLQVEVSTFNRNIYPSGRSLPKSTGKTRWRKVVDRKGQSAVTRAARRGHLDVVRYLIAHGADIRAVAHDGSTLLWFAVSSGNVELVEYLLAEFGANSDIDAVGGADQEPPLMLATASGHSSLMRLLLYEGANINGACSSGGTALIKAADRGSIDDAVCLARHGADVNFADAIKGTALIRAASSSGSLELVQFLVDAGADINASNFLDSKPLLCATSIGNLACVMYLVEMGADVSAVDMRGYSVLDCAVESGSTRLVEYFVDCIASKEVLRAFTRVNPLILLVVHHGSISIAKTLVDRGANIHAVNQQGDSVLTHTTRHPNIDFEMVNYLVSAGADVNTRDSEGFSPLHYAVFYGDIAVVRYLIDHGANVDITTHFGHTPLMTAARDNLVNIATVLIELGANVNAVRDDAETVLTIAASAASRETAQILIDHGAGVNFVNLEGKTALMNASKFGLYGLVKSLVERGAPVNSVDSNGKTALMFACDCSVKEAAKKCARILIESGADVSLVDNIGETVLSYAIREGHEEIVAMLGVDGCRLFSH